MLLPNTVATFVQVNAMKGLGAHSKAAVAGACHNFTIDWIGQMLADGGEVTDALAKKRMQTMRARNGAGNPVLQKVFGARWSEGGNSYKLADQMMIKIRGLKEVELAFDYSAYDQKRLVQCVKSPAGQGMVYSFWFDGAVVGAGGGAHTIGFFRPMAGSRGSLKPSGSNVSCFDPNFGECYVPGIEFNFWFNKMKAMYGPMRHQMMKIVDRL